MRRTLEAIYRGHRQGLFTLALAITGRAEPAEDAVHEAFVRLWKQKRPLAGDLVAYVFAAVRNAAIDQVRRRAAARQAPESIFDHAATNPAAAAVEAEQFRLLRQAVEALPPRQCEAVVLKTYAGLTFQQMASVLDEPLPTVASRYRRALDRIGRALRESQ